MYQTNKIINISFGIVLFIIIICLVYLSINKYDTYGPFAVFILIGIIFAVILNIILGDNTKKIYILNTLFESIAASIGAVILGTFSSFATDSIGAHSFFMAFIGALIVTIITQATINSVNKNRVKINSYKDSKNKNISILNKGFFLLILDMKH